MWDGKQCSDEGIHEPTWFSVDLLNDDIEVRVCHDQDIKDEGIPIEKKIGFTQYPRSVQYLGGGKD